MVSQSLCPILRLFQPIVDPQSHLANMRTKPDYEFEISGKKLDGRLQWLSIPVIVIVDDIDRHAGAIEQYKRLDEGTKYEKPGIRPLIIVGSEASSSPSSSITVILYIILAGLTLLFLSLVFLIVRRTRRKRRATTSGNDGIARNDVSTAGPPGSDGSSDVVDFDCAIVHTSSGAEIF
jgi:hypothetical protein